MRNGAETVPEDDVAREQTLPCNDEPGEARRGMDRDGFTAYLKERNYTDETIGEAIAIAEGFESFLAESGRPMEPASEATGTTHLFSKRMIERGINTWDNYVALLRYGRFIGNDAVFTASLELIDGAEALERLYEKLADENGDDVRDEIFEGIELPPLGTPNDEKPALMGAVIRRLEASLGPGTCVGLLKDSLRYLDDQWFLDQKAMYEEAGGIDAYLDRKGRDFIAELEKHRDEGSFYFSQPITDAVIDYVIAHPEIRSGVRDGNRILEAKIPHQAVKFLEATDAAEKAYRYCHCPWAKESLRDGPSTVPPIFCNCSAGFHKKPYEVIFGQPLRAEVLESVLAGDPWCKFAIDLPDGVVEP
jgi:hypothetical protein